MSYTADTIIAFDGAEQSIAEHALDYGVTPGTIIERLEAGWSIERAITTPMVAPAGYRLPTLHKPKVTRIPRGKLIEFNGEVHTIAEWSRLTGVSRNTLNNRLRRGFTLADTFYAGSLNGIRLTFNGETKKLGEWAKQLGIGIGTLQHRIRHGWTTEEALTLPVGNRDEGGLGRLKARIARLEAENATLKVALAEAQSDRGVVEDFSSADQDRRDSVHARSAQNGDFKEAA